MDIGGQDTKVIRILDGQVTDFLMNDKCAAGTGKFIEVMANRLGMDLKEFYREAEAGTPAAIRARVEPQTEAWEVEPLEEITSETVRIA